MSKRGSRCLAPLKIVITPAPRGAGRYEARLDGDDRVLCVSRTPFLDAAKAMIVAGHKPYFREDRFSGAGRYAACRALLSL